MLCLHIYAITYNVESPFLKCAIEFVGNNQNKVFSIK